MFPKLIDVHVKNLQNIGFNNLNDWLSNPKHLYIGRRNIYVGVEQSKFHNPFPVKKYGLNQSIKLYYELWKNKDVKELMNYEEIGCWCLNCVDIPSSIDDCECHGQVLLYILNQQINEVESN